MTKWRAKRGQPPPNHAALINVELDPKHSDLWTAFLDLKGSAGIGMAPEPVTTSDVLAWCEIHEIPRWRWRTFWSVVHHLDRQARQLMRSKRDDDSQASD